MKKKVIGIVLIAIGLFSVFGAFGISSGAPAVAEIISNAVYVSDGKALPENEGKVVIVPGALNAEPFVDKETGITIRDAVVFRHVEKLYIEEDTEKETEYWVWKNDVSAFGGEKKIISPNVTLGEFVVTEELIQSLTANEKRTEYSDKELNQMGWNTFIDEGRTYLYQGDRMPLNKGKIDSVNTWSDKYAYRDYIGTYRVSYTEMDGGPDFTIVAVQESGQLVRVPDVTLQAVHSGYLTKDDIMASQESSAKIGTIIAIGAAVVCVGLGILLIVKGGKKRP